jgi:hypothetical protein
MVNHNKTCIFNVKFPPLSLKIFQRIGFNVLFPILFFGLNTYANIGITEMNGVTLRQFGRIEKDWKLITVRYREDSKEMRFTYANPLAYDALLQGQDYPDNAVFAKIGVLTGHDPAFVSSRVPSETRRFQFMVRNKEKFASTGGWGYALFDSDGFVFEKDLNFQSKACHACHNIVADRHYVFSQLVNLNPGKKHVPVNSEKLALGRLKFESVSRSIVPKDYQSKIPKQYKKIRIYRGEVSNNLFLGSVDELKATLIHEVQQHRIPAVVLPTVTTSIIVVNPGLNDKACGLEVATKKSYDFSYQTDINLCAEK